MPLPHNSKNLNDRDEGRYYFCRTLAPPNAPPLLTPQYLTILMTERGGGGIICRILAHPPPPQTPQYFTILMTEKGGAIIFCRILAPPPPNGTLPDATILTYLNNTYHNTYLNDREGGHCFVGFGYPLPFPRRHNT